MMGRYLAAAKAVNVASKAPAEQGAAKAMGRVLQGNPRHRLHPGSSAGLKANPAGVVEFADTGYRKWAQSRLGPIRPTVQLGRPGPGMGVDGITDLRIPRRPALDMDRDLAGLL